MDDSVHRSDQKLEILFVTSDLFPPFRPAAKAVFAEGLAARGHRIDWLLQAAEPTSRSGRQPFKGGVAYVAATNAGNTRFARFKRHLADAVNDFKVFGLLRQHRYSLVQIKDKYFGALVAIAAASSSARGSTSAAGSTVDRMPIRSASAPSTSLPVKSISAARDAPTMRGRR